MSPEDRRTHPRARERIPVAIADATGEITVDTQNLSGSGAYCTLDRFIAPMTKVRLRLELPADSQPGGITCTGVVVRVEPMVSGTQKARYNVAIFFTDLAERDRSRITQFVRRRLAQSVQQSSREPPTRTGA